MGMGTISRLPGGVRWYSDSAGAAERCLGSDAAVLRQFFSRRLVQPSRTPINPSLLFLAANRPRS